MEDHHALTFVHHMSCSAVLEVYIVFAAFSFFFLFVLKELVKKVPQTTLAVMTSTLLKMHVIIHKDSF